MYLDSFDVHRVLREKAARMVAGVLIVGMVLLGSPLHFVFAEEAASDTADTAPVAESSPEESTTTAEDSPPTEESSDVPSEETESEVETLDSETSPPEEDTKKESNSDNSEAENPVGEATDTEEEESTSDTIIETGDAIAEAETQNEVNTNVTTTDTSEKKSEESDTEIEESSDEEGNTQSPEDVEENEEDTVENDTETSAENVDETDSTSVDVQETTTEGESSEIATEGENQEEVDTSEEEETTREEPSGNTEGGTGGSSTTVENENEAVATTSLAVEADTGENTATTTEGGAIVDTGNALASANVVNVVNTNITNSSGFLLLLNALFGAGTFDLRDFNFWSQDDVTPSSFESLGGSPCSLTVCDDEDIDFTITGSSTAQIVNDVIVRSGTGNNTAQGANASITTGNAYAGANVVNVANTNVIDSNYLLVALNNFGDFDGDIVFPGLSFFKEFFQKSGGNSAVSITNNNEADVSNNVSAQADTGSNSATSSQGAIIETGDASADAAVVNSVNTNLLGDSSLLILLRVHGSWSGDVFGLPPGISWAETPWGIQLVSTPEGHRGEESAAPRYSTLAAQNQNTASIRNNVEVFALTGENKVEGQGGDASIVTGDARAGANVVNVVNSNIVGRNWILAVFNIFGDWTGNFSFGRPDLWVGGRAESPNNPITPESPVTFHYTVTNFGDAAAHDVRLVNTTSPYLQFDGYDRKLGEHILFDIGTLPPGASREVSYRARVTNSLPSGGATSILTKTTVESNETDNNSEDNLEELSIVATRNERKETASQRNGLPYADIQIEKNTAATEVTASSTVTYTIVVNNYGTSAYNATLHDILRDPNGVEVSQKSWPLGEIFPDEEITVSYDVIFSASSTPGIYSNSARVEALDTRSIARGGNANSEIVETTLTVLEIVEEVEEAEEIEEETPPVVEATGSGIAHARGSECSVYITEYIRPGDDNSNLEVTKLQQFLIEHEGHTYLEMTGEYDLVTELALRDFQETYRQVILDPWGIENPTGYVFYTTMKHINELYCGEGASFELTEEQLAEIEAFKERARKLREEGLPVDTSRVGQNTLYTPVRTLREEEENIELAAVPSLRELVAGTASSVEKKSIEDTLERLMRGVDGIVPWSPQTFDFLNILGINR